MFFLRYLFLLNSEFIIFVSFLGLKKGKIDIQDDKRGRSNFGLLSEKIFWI